MKVKQIKKDGDKITLEAVATAQEAAQALQAAKMAFAQSMGMKPPAQGQTIDQAAEEQMGIKNLSSIVEGSGEGCLPPECGIPLRSGCCPEAGIRAVVL